MGFYGNLANVARTTFSFDKTYTTRLEMVVKCPTDEVFIGRYALLDYDHEDSIRIVEIVSWLKDNHPNNNWEIVKKVGNNYYSFIGNEKIEPINNNTYYIVIDGENASFDSPKLFLGSTAQTVPNSDQITVSDWYNLHYNIDKKVFNNVGRGWDSTVWQKTYKDNEIAYVMIAELNGVVPTIDILNDPPVWLDDIPVSSVENSEYLYRSNHMTPYFDEEDRTNLYYRLHMQSPWKFGEINVTGLENPEEGATDGVSLNYSSSGDIYSYEIGTTGSAVDTINFNFALPSIGKALAENKQLLYGGGSEDIDPANQNQEGKNNISYFNSPLNPSALKSVAGALNTIWTIIGENITNSSSTDNSFPEGSIYYNTYSNLIALNDVDESAVDDFSSYEDDSENHYWYRYVDTDEGLNRFRYKELKGYPSYNSILLSLSQSAANFLDTLDDLQNRAEDLTGIPNTLLVVDTDHRIGGLTLVGDNAVIVDNEFQTQTRKNLLPYPNNWRTIENNEVIYGKRVENGLTFELNPDKTITVNGTASQDTEVIIAENVPLSQGSYILSGCTGGADNSYWLSAIKNDDDSSNDIIVREGDSNAFIINADNFYFDYIKIIIKEGVTLNNQTFEPMIRAESDDNTYVPYQNDYTLKIQHATQDSNKLNPSEDTPDLDTLYEPTINEFGHITELKKKQLPNYYSSIKLKDDQDFILTPQSIGDELDLTEKFDNLYFSKENDKIIFKPAVSVKINKLEPTFQDAGAISNEVEWKEFPVLAQVGVDTETNDLLFGSRDIPFPVSAVSVSTRPVDGGGNPISINWDSDTVVNSYYYPEYKKVGPSEAEKPGKIISFAPGDDWIRMGIYTNSSDGNNVDTRKVLIGHKVQTNLKGDNGKSPLIGEINNLINRQPSRIYNLLPEVDGQKRPYTKEELMSESIDVLKGAFTETIYLNPDKNSTDGLFSTISLEVDEGGHITNMKQINVKLIADSLFQSFLKPKKITPFLTKFYHGEPTDGSEGYGFGAYSVGDKIYFNANESPLNYMYIGVRYGVDNYDLGGSGTCIQYFPSSLLRTNNLQVIYHSNGTIFAITFKYFAADESHNERFEIIGNNTWYVPGDYRGSGGDGSTSAFTGTFEATQNIRGYNYSDGVWKSNTVAADASAAKSWEVQSNHDWIDNPWLRDGSSTPVKIKSPYAGKWMSAYETRSIDNAPFIGIRQIYGIGFINNIGTDQEDTNSDN